MNAHEALQLTESKTPSIEDKEYDLVIKRIKIGSENGRKDIIYFSYFNFPSDKVQERLRNDGYHFHVYKCFPFPEMYSICWENHQPKKNWLRTFVGKLLK